MKKQNKLKILKNQELVPLNNDLYSDLSIEELEERLETACGVNVNCGCNDADTCGVDDGCGVDGCVVDGCVADCAIDVYSGGG